MGDKTAKELLKQLTRIADALDKQNLIEENKIKRESKIRDLREKKLRSDLRENKYININEDKITKEKPNFKGSDFRDTSVFDK